MPPTTLSTRRQNHLSIAARCRYVDIYIKSLPNPKKKAASWLRKHPMDCIVWAAEKARSEGRETNSSDSEADDQAREGILPDSEKEALRSFSLVEDDVTAELVRPGTSPQDYADETDGEEEGQQEIQEQSTSALKRALQKCIPNSLRHRQISHLLETQMQLEKEKKDREEYWYSKMKKALISKGVSPENAELLPRNEQEPTPTAITEELSLIQHGIIEAEKETRKEKAKEAYENVWVINTEKELHYCMVWLNSTIIDDEHRAALASQRDVLCDLTNLGLTNCDEALEERKRKYIFLGLLEEQNKYSVKSVYEALPIFYRGSSDKDEADIFVIPVPTPSPANAHKRLAVEQSCHRV